MKSRTILEWALAFFLILIFPSENWLILVDSKPEDWYGELVLPVEGETYIVAKNSGAKSVNPRLANADKFISWQTSYGYGVDVSSQGSARILPESLALIRVGRGTAVEERRLAWMGDDVYFKTNRLSIMTRSDFSQSYWIVAGLSAASILLGFLVARLIEESSEAKID